MTEETAQNDVVTLAFAISDNYAQHLAVVLTSVFENSPGVSVEANVLCNGLSQDSESRLRQLETEHSGRFSLRVHRIDRSRFTGFPLPIEHISQETYYRYLLPELLPHAPRVIYLDADLIVRRDIRQLWRIPLVNHFIGAVDDHKENSPEFVRYKKKLGMSPSAAYFNAGVLLMDLDALRRIDFTRQCFEKTSQLAPHLDWPDQDVINTVLEGKILPLPDIYNFTSRGRHASHPDIVIRHFAAFTSKPWCCLWKNNTWREYLHYLRRSPYRDRAWAFLAMHLRGRILYRYTKKGITRIFFLGIPIWRR